MVVIVAVVSGGTAVAVGGDVVVLFGAVLLHARIEWTLPLSLRGVLFRRLAELNIIKSKKELNTTEEEEQNDDDD